MTLTRKDHMPYRLMFHLPDGHRIFSKEDHQGLLIADESGPTPDQTEDGELYLDMAKNLSIEQATIDGRIDTYFAIPLRAADGSAHHAASNAASLIQLATSFDWKITIGTPGQSRNIRVFEA